MTAPWILNRSVNRIPSIQVVATPRSAPRTADRVRLSGPYTKKMIMAVRTAVMAMPVQTGEQLCTLEIGNGIFAGQTLEGVNFLSGSLEKDKIFKTGDRALLTISYKGQEIKSVILSDHYRLDKEFILLAVFAVFLVVFAGKIGFQAILSFFITILMIWKVLVPCYLKGCSPDWIRPEVIIAELSVPTTLPTARSVP